MVLGNMDVGINTQNLVAILLVVFLSVVNIFGLENRSAHPECVYRGEGFGATRAGVVRISAWEEMLTLWRQTSADISGTTLDWARSMRYRWEWADRW